jgi:ABC-2 type transport system ATP-binding protein
MDEAENCNRIAIIDHGEIVALDTPEALKGLVGGDIVTVRTPDSQQAAEKLKAMHNVESRLGPDGQLIIEIAQGDQFIPQMMMTLTNSGTPVTVQSVNLRRPTLEDVFIKLTGHAIREQEAGAVDQMRARRQMHGRH